MQAAALAVAEDASEFENLFLTRRQQFLGGEFRRSVQIERAAAGVGQDRLGLEGMQMRFIAWGCG